MKTSMILVLGLSFTLSAAQAAVIRVPDDVPSINTALGLAGPGGTVRVSTGTYYEAVAIPFDHQTLVADGRVVVNPLGLYGLYVAPEVRGTVVRGLRFRNCHTGMDIRGEGTVVEGCQVRDTTASGVQVYDADNVHVERTKIKNVGEHGIYISYSSLCVVEACSIRNASGTGILLGGEFNSVIDCRISDVAQEGIQVGSDVLDAVSCLLQGNSVTDTGADGIELEAGAATCTVAGNTVVGAGYDGIDIRWQSDANALTGNRVHGSGDGGIEVDGLSCSVVRNKVTHSSSDGISVQSSGDDGYYFKNKVKGSGGDGFDIWGAGNDFNRNKAKRNLGYDRFSHVPLADNDWTDNRFNTSNL